MAGLPNFLELPITSLQQGKMPENTEIFTVPVEEYECSSEIGRGGASTVYKCFKKGCRSEVFALKKLKDPMTAAIEKKLQEEVDMIRKVNHIHVVRVRGVSYFTDKFERKYCGIILEPLAVSKPNNLELYLLTAKWSLNKVADEERNSLLVDQRAKILSWIVCLANALHHVHAFSIVHRDIKLKNILIHQDRVILTDFGISIIARENPKDDDTKTTASAEWLAPECLPKDFKDDGILESIKRQTKESDIFALGCVFSEMLGSVWPEDEETRGSVRSEDEETREKFSLPPKPVKDPVQGKHKIYRTFWEERANENIDGDVRQPRPCPSSDQGYLKHSHNGWLPQRLSDMELERYLKDHLFFSQKFSPYFRDYGTKKLGDLPGPLKAEILVDRLQKPALVVLMNDWGMIWKMVDRDPRKRPTAQAVLDYTLKSRRAVNHLANPHETVPEENCSCTILPKYDLWQETDAWVRSQLPGATAQAGLGPSPSLEMSMSKFDEPDFPSSPESRASSYHTPLTDAVDSLQGGPAQPHETIQLESPFPCELCLANREDRSFWTDINTFKEHVRSLHIVYCGQKIMCIKCRKSFGGEGELVTHVLANHIQRDVPGI
jgi:serine/threonine protein kinase